MHYRCRLLFVLPGQEAAGSMVLVSRVDGHRKRDRLPVFCHKRAGAVIVFDRDGKPSVKSGVITPVGPEYSYDERTNRHRGPVSSGC